jgi:hypothetical protein
MYNLSINDNDTPLLFTVEEKQKINTILLNKLNSGIYKFNNIVFLNELFYYNNFNGKDIDTIFFTVDCDNNFDNLAFNVNIAIRNDIKRNVEYLVILSIKLLISSDFKISNSNKDLMDYTINNSIFDRTNYATDFYLNDFNFDDNIDHVSFNYNKNYDPINYNVQPNEDN